MRILLFICFCLYFSLPTQAQRKRTTSNSSETVSHIDTSLFEAIQWRSIGPYRGGRSCTAAGVAGKPNLYYFGATGGGVWKTVDGGRSWKNLSDGYFGGSVGAIAVSEYDPNVIYVGGGEQTVRGNVSSGYGIWKSVDGGKTWNSMGLKESRHIARIRIHPRNPDLVYAAVLGNIYKEHPERGVFRSKDGGQTWEKILFVNDNVGAIDLTFDPNNPRILYASSWRVRRTPYSMSSGGQGSALWKSTDGGNNWEEISTKPGFPKDTLGIIGVTVSPVNSERVWAIVEAKDGGVFRSDNGGMSWKKLNEERKLRQRAWYYTRIYADPMDEDKVYVMNVRYHRSKDGGKTFETFSSPHSDNHDLWIAPEDPDRMIIADDGGAQITYDGGQTWSTYHNQATAQFYRVTTDDHFPYRIYVAQQDNSTLRISHRGPGYSLSEDDWESTAGCECGHIAPDPDDNDIVYGGCYDGFLERLDHKNDISRAVSVWPDNPMGYGAEGMKYRFQWNFPLFFSPHDSDKLYAASNHLHVSKDEGQSWQIISPDLTRNDPSKLVSSGGPITKDNTSVEYYCTIFAAAESPRVKDLLWAGTDDGRLHVSQDAGTNWTEVTPKGLPEWAMINSIECDPHVDGGLYVAATMYKWGDFKPYLFKTKDYGKTWTKIVNGIDEEHFTRVVRADPKRQGLLYAGTETGMYLSFDDGASWQSMQLNLPIVPITDLAVKNDNLIASTQGRSIWMIDDLTPFQQYDSKLTQKDFHLFKPLAAYRMKGGQSKNPKNAGFNHPGGAMMYVYLRDTLSSTDSVVLEIMDANGNVAKTLSSFAKEKSDQLKLKKGSNLLKWDMRYPKAKKFEGMILWWANLNGPKAVPGEYTVRLKINNQIEEQALSILKDPRVPLSNSDIQSQFDFMSSIRDQVTTAHETIINIRKVKTQLKPYQKRFKGDDSRAELLNLIEQMDSTLTAVENELYQTKNRSPQDPLNFPIKLTNKLAHLNSLVNMSDYPPTDQMIAVRDELTQGIEKQLSIYKQVVENDLPKFNKMMREQEVDAIQLE